MAAGLALLAKTVWLAALAELKKGVRQVQGDAQDLQGKLIHIHVIQIAKHGDGSVAARDDSKGGAGSRLAPVCIKRRNPADTPGSETVSTRPGRKR